MSKEESGAKKKIVTSSSELKREASKPLIQLYDRDNNERVSKFNDAKARNEQSQGKTIYGLRATLRSLKPLTQ